MKRFKFNTWAFNQHYAHAKVLEGIEVLIELARNRGWGEGFRAGRRFEARKRSASCRRRYATNRGRCACGKEPCPHRAGREVEA